MVALKKTSNVFVSNKEAIYYHVLFAWGVLIVMAGVLTANINLLLAVILWGGIRLAMRATDAPKVWAYNPIGRWIFEFFERPRVRNLLFFTLAVSILGYGPYIPYNKFTYTVEDSSSGNLIKTIHADEYGWYIPFVQRPSIWNETLDYAPNYSVLKMRLADDVEVYVDFDISLHITGDPETSIAQMYQSYESPDGYRNVYEAAVNNQLISMFAVLTLDDMGSGALDMLVKDGLDLSRYNLEVTDAKVKDIIIDRD